MYVTPFYSHDRTQNKSHSQRRKLRLREVTADRHATHEGGVPDLKGPALSSSLSPGKITPAPWAWLREALRLPLTGLNCGAGDSLPGVSGTGILALISLQTKQSGHWAAREHLLAVRTQVSYSAPPNCPSRGEFRARLPHRLKCRSHSRGEYQVLTRGKALDKYALLCSQQHRHPRHCPAGCPGDQMPPRPVVYSTHQLHKH